MHAAVVELDALANAVWPGAKNHRPRLAGRPHLIRILIGLVVIASATSKFCGAGVNGLKGWQHSEHFAMCAHLLLAYGGRAQISYLGVGKADALGLAQPLSAQTLQAAAPQLFLGGNDAGDAMDEPGVDLRSRRHRRHAPAPAQGLGDVEQPLLGRQPDQLVEALFVKIVLAVRTQAASAVFQGTHRLVQRLFKGTANGHHLADSLHPRGQGSVGALELLKRETRRLHHHVVDSRLEAGRGGLGDVVEHLVQAVTNGQLGGELGYRESGGLGRQGR